MARSYDDGRLDVCETIQDILGVCSDPTRLRIRRVLSYLKAEGQGRTMEVPGKDLDWNQIDRQLV